MIDHIAGAGSYMYNFVVEGTKAGHAAGVLGYQSTLSERAKRRITRDLELATQDMARSAKNMPKGSQTFDGEAPVVG